MTSVVQRLSLCSLAAFAVFGSDYQLPAAAAPVAHMSMPASDATDGQWGPEGARLYLAKKPRPGRQQRIDSCIADARMTYREILRECDRDFAPNSEDRVQCYRTGWLSYQIMEGRCGKIQ